jgi:hypothetical protein
MENGSTPLVGSRIRRGSDLVRHSRTFGDKMAAEAWLNAERLLIEGGVEAAPRARG